MRCCREEAFLRSMSPSDPQMAASRKDGHLAAMGCNFFEVGSGRIVSARLFGEKILGYDSHVRLDGDEAAGDFSDGLRAGKGGHHCVQQWQADGGASSLEEGAAREVALSADMHGGEG